MPPPHEKRNRYNSSKFLTRTQALKKLQVPLKSFRQLCIYKGIHPRVPKKSTGDARVFYHNKDIKFLAHEPSIEVLRKQRQFHRKIRSAVRRKDVPEAKRLEKRFPKLSLSHILKERYPTFQHALRDLDDPLTMAHLYANLHQQGQHRDAPQIHKAAAQLCAEFRDYVVRTRSLRKVFVSVKGYYYQAEIMGIPVTWCVPHKFVQNFDHKQIDPFIMLCYMEFYRTMLGFVNFRLFHSIGMHYPPQLTPSVYQEAALEEDAPFQEESTALIEKVDGLEEEDEELVEVDEEEEVGERAVGETGDVPVHDDSSLCAKLFKGLVFFLGRETPVEQLIFAIQAFGGTVAWEDDSSAFDVTDTHITHCVCDRPAVKEEFKGEGREYVQPQWIFDCCNARVLLPTELYAVGKTAPPHLSPFVSSNEEGYVPDYAKQIQKIQEAANLIRESNDTAAQEQAIQAMLADDVTFQEEQAQERAQLEEREYLGELELELETEFPMSVSREEENAARKKRRATESLQETQKMEEIMVSKRHQFKKLKRKEEAKKTKIERLQRKRASLAASKSDTSS